MAEAAKKAQGFDDCSARNRLRPERAHNLEGGHSIMHRRLEQFIRWMRESLIWEGAEAQARKSGEDQSLAVGSSSLAVPRGQTPGP